jgi:hypothetical protein
LIERKQRLLLIETDDDALRYSEEFDDPVRLLGVADRTGLSKRSASPHVSGIRSGWIKVKTASWREANRDRGELLAKQERRKRVQVS